MLDRWFVHRSQYEEMRRKADTEINRLGRRVNHLAAVNDRLRSTLADRATKLGEALVTVETLRVQLDESEIEHAPLTSDEHDKLVHSRCLHCGGSHIISCPRVRRIRFRADGQTPLEVEYDPDFVFPAHSIIWIEEHPIKVAEEATGEEHPLVVINS